VTTTETIVARTAPDDVIVRALARNWHTMRRSFAIVPTIRLRDDARAFWFSTGIPSAWFNAVLFARFTPEEADAEIADISAHYRAQYVPWLWFIDPDSRPDDLGTRLLAHGMERAFDCRNMALALTDAPLAGPLPPGVSIHRVVDDATFALWRTVALIGDERDDRASIDLQIATAQVPDRLHFVATLRGEPVARATIVPAAGVAGLYGVATLPPARGRGIGYAITCAALDAARGLGYEVAVLQSSPMGYPIYTRIGFHALPVFPVYVWRPPE
jgi:GNAT superfamily N-acetyltransferase